jgi:hypothetical protein
LLYAENDFGLIVAKCKMHRDEVTGYLLYKLNTLNNSIHLIAVVYSISISLTCKICLMRVICFQKKETGYQPGTDTPFGGLG